MTLRKFLFIIIFTLGCVNAPYSEFHPPVNDTPESLFIIYIKEYGQTFDAITIKENNNNQIRLGSLKERRPFYTTNYKTEFKMFENIFFRDQIMPGTYTPSLIHYNDVTTDTGEATFKLKNDKNIKFTATKSSVYFLGSYQVFTAQTGRIPYRYLERIETPTEAEVLQKFLLKAKGSYWEPQIEARLQEVEINQALQTTTPTSTSPANKRNSK